LPATDGGRGRQWEGNEARRIERLLRPSNWAPNCRYRIQRQKRRKYHQTDKKRAECLLSFHDFQKTPSLDVLKQIVNKELRAGADICKVVTTAQTFEDNLR